MGSTYIDRISFNITIAGLPTYRRFLGVAIRSGWHFETKSGPFEYRPDNDQTLILLTVHLNSGREQHFMEYARRNWEEPILEAVTT